MSIPPSDHAAAIVAHYLRVLTERAGLRWTSANDADMDTLADLLADAAPELGTIPPYQPIVSDRQTVVLDRDELDPAFERWRRERQDEQAVRMLRRERGER